VHPPTIPTHPLRCNSSCPIIQPVCILNSNVVGLYSAGPSRLHVSHMQLKPTLPAHTLMRRPAAKQRTYLYATAGAQACPHD
jgi:hypothetical protein